MSSTGLQRQGVPIGTNQSPWKMGLQAPAANAALHTILCTNAVAPAFGDYALIVPTAKSALSAGEGAASQGAAFPVATSLANGVFPFAVPELTNRANFKFFLANAADETMTAYIFALSRLIRGGKCEWVGDFLGSLVITAGAKAVNASSQILPSVTSNNDSVRWADTITPTDDSFNDSWEVFSDSADGAAVASVDHFGAEVIVPVLVTGTCESMGFVWREC